MYKTSLFGAVVCVVALAGAGAAPASAQGQVERGPAHANSICSYSGQNDEPDADFPEGGRVQSYGQLVKAGLKGQVPSPGMLCNGHLFPFPEGFGPEVP
ncbi:hypothetical protein ASF21_08500 [Arthrobacter sp. Leaf234]|jgi:hypothetical protein|uniref:hypothetical protein n=1 Tax=Arthrobacter sp. Leaf234 TaxID=1736303 RepID=UPI0006F8A7B9|nr:hypothetical protein [Arthrobacter sp. Leaf234]KQO01640.1 hypothetical protein ASF21_08500 [Arthrobacter sp. Leaf234]